MDEDEAGVRHARQGPPKSDDSLSANVERLILSGKDVAEAELQWAKLKGLSLAAIARRGLFFGAVAMVGMMVGLSLLLVAVIVALIPVVGLLVATLIVIGIALLIAVIAGLLARRAFHELVKDIEP